MKTQYFRRPKAALSPRQSIVAGAIVFLFFILLVLRVFFPGAFTALMSPLWGVGTFFTEATRSKDSKEDLAARVALLEAENETLRNENRLLRENAGEDTVPYANGVTAGVIARPPLSPYDVLIVNKGSGDGVYEGMQAYANGIPVGTVESVSGGSARVALYSSSGRAIEGWVGEERIPITLAGLGGGAFSADLPRDSGVVEGATVFITGAGALPVGVVARIESHPSSPRSIVHLRPAANPFTITSVTIVAAPSL
jgi:cell shape-determining protein MreC